MRARESIDRLRDTGSLDLRLICSVFLRAPVFPVSVCVIHCQLPSSLSPTVSSAMLFFIFPCVSSFLLVTCTGVPFFLWSGHASEVYIDYRALIYTSVDNEGNGSPEKGEYSGPQSLFRNFHLIVERLNRNWFCNVVAHSVRS